jgi:hypothetical protein
MQRPSILSVSDKLAIFFNKASIGVTERQKGFDAFRRDRILYRSRDIHSFDVELAFIDRRLQLTSLKL